MLFRSDLDLSKITFFHDNGKTAVRPNETTLGGSLVLRGTTYESGIGTHAPSVAVFKLNGATKFNALVGIDDDVVKDGEGIVDMIVTLYKNNSVDVQETVRITRTDAAPVELDIPLTADHKYLKIEFDQAGQPYSDHVDLVNAYFTGGQPVTIDRVAAPTGNNITQVSSLDLTPVTCFNDNGKTAARANRSTLNGPLVMKDILYESGVGTHAPSLLCFRLEGATHFNALAGIDDAASTDAAHGIVDMTVTLYRGDTPETYRSATLNRSDAEADNLDIDLTGFDFMKIEFATGANAWADHSLMPSPEVSAGTQMPSAPAHPEPAAPAPVENDFLD